MKFNQIIGDRRTGRTSILVEQGVHSVLAGQNVLVIASTQNQVQFIISRIATKLEYLTKDLPEFNVTMRNRVVELRVPIPDFYDLYGIRYPTPGTVTGASYSPLYDYWAQLRGKQVNVVLIDNADYLGKITSTDSEPDESEALRDLMYSLATIASPERVWTVSERPLDLSSGL